MNDPRQMGVTMKRLCSIVMVIAIAAVMLTACGEKPKRFDRVDVGSVKHVTISVDGDEKPENDILKRTGVTELVDMYNSAKLFETDEAKTEDLKKEQTLYFFRYYDYDDKLIGECVISPDGYVYMPEEGDTLYRLKEGFDEEAVKNVIAEYDINARPPVV